MKNLLRKLFSPILNPLERGDEPYHYKPLSRKVLLFIGVVFGFLAGLVLYLRPEDGDLGHLIPVVVFGLVSLLGLIVGLLGSDRAVARIWGNR